jgi:pyrroloquinoline quinone biosynthesis protein E
VEIAHAQYYGWAFKNRSRLLPSRGQVMQALTTVERLRDRYRGRLVIDSVPPDYFARYPKPCVGGWGRRSLNVTPSGKVLPCHAAELLPNLEFWTVHEHSLTEIWAGPAFEAFRGTAWMQAPCRTCPKREVDFGGCRCQAFMLTQDARAADPVCHLSSHHSIIEQAQALSAQAYHYRGR